MIKTILILLSCGGLFGAGAGFHKTGQMRHVAFAWLNILTILLFV